MPRKKTVVPDEQPMEAQVPSEATEEENAGQFPETAPGEEGEKGVGLVPASGPVPYAARPGLAAPGPPTPVVPPWMMRGASRALPFG